MERTFQVDLRGIVDLFSRHLYASPRVYMRELLQNAVDAITARRAIDPGAPAVVSIEPPEVTGDGTLRIHDSGIGLSEPEVHELLATIGRSSKRDDLGLARHEFLGQFGIGLLSCFLVADEVRVTTRSAHGGPTVEWTGLADGRYRVAPATRERTEPGTTVTLSPVPGMARWLAGEMVNDLVASYGDALPVTISIAGRRVNSGALPWQHGHPSPAARAGALRAYAERVFGFAPFDVIDLAVPEAGLTGLAFVLPMAANPAAQSGHRVYLRRMLLADGVDKLLPEWAFFVRCVVDTGELRPTASREALYEDDLLADTREALGAQVRDWLVRLAATEPDRLRQFLAVHHLGVKSLALHDVEMLRVVDRWWPMETDAGPMTLADFRRRHPVVRYTATADEFRVLAAVASAQNFGLVNGGYAYDIEIMRRLPLLDPAIVVRRLDPTELATRFEPPDPVLEARLRPFLTAAAGVLRNLGCDVVPRSFDPPALPALYLTSRAAVQAAEMRTARSSAGELWSGVLGAVDTTDAAHRPQLILNLRNPVVRRVAEVRDPALAALGVQALYGQALLSGHHPLRPEDGAMLNRSFLDLLDWAIGAAGAR
ncbi:HSP90 family protein [Nonomuraea turcica]|uniref:HSP90 family protein n=1 Tax=Nonomuraea sp. G32 TaxID=3067274 RepID=UPI00273C11B1|nr:HSP90 family protein [Nonomuraea sp. G32]MDP4502625.1 HSP90 family protein [Nonomuraea sp. G32]